MSSINNWVCASMIELIRGWLHWPQRWSTADEHVNEYQSIRSAASHMLRPLGHFGELLFQLRLLLSHPGCGCGQGRHPWGSWTQNNKVGGVL